MDKLIPNGPNVIHNIVPNKTNSQYVRVAQKGLFWDAISQMKVFPHMEVSISEVPVGVPPIAGWFIHGKFPKMGDLGVAPFQETSICLPDG